MNNSKHFKYLIISPHLDDEVLGSFAFLGNDSFVLYCGIDESKIKGEWVKDRPSRQQRVFEMNNISNTLNFKYHILENKVNFYVLQDLISQFEKHINIIKPDIVLIPNPSYNQDHRAVYEAMLTALRPHDINFFVKKVLIYEQIQDLWNQNYHKFNANFFKRIDVNEKTKAYEMYKSQVRSFRSSDMIIALARLRGAQSNEEYSEAFEVLRWVD